MDILKGKKEINKKNERKKNCEGKNKKNIIDKWREDERKMKNERREIERKKERKKMNILKYLKS